MLYIVNKYSDVAIIYTYTSIHVYVFVFVYALFFTTSHLPWLVTFVISMMEKSYYTIAAALAHVNKYKTMVFLTNFNSVYISVL